MIYCPKRETWIFRYECDINDECWELEDWDTCIILKKKVEKAEIEDFEDLGGD